MVKIYNELSTEENLTQVLDKYADKLVAYINALIRDVRSAEDLMMDIFVSLIKNKLTFDDEAQFRAYLYKSAKNKAYSHLKTNNRIVPLSEDVLSDQYELEDKILSNLVKKKVYDYLDKLPLKYKQVLYLTYIEDLPSSEVAEILGVKLPALKSLRQRAKKKLNRFMKNENLFIEEDKDEN